MSIDGWGVQVLDEHERHPGRGRQRPDEFGDRFEAAGRGADADDRYGGFRPVARSSRADLVGGPRGSTLSSGPRWTEGTASAPPNCRRVAWRFAPARAETDGGAASPATPCPPSGRRPTRSEDGQVVPAGCGITSTSACARRPPPDGGPPNQPAARFKPPLFWRETVLDGVASPEHQWVRRRAAGRRSEAERLVVPQPAGTPPPRPRCRPPPSGGPPIGPQLSAFLRPDPGQPRRCRVSPR